MKFIASILDYICIAGAILAFVVFVIWSMTNMIEQRLTETVPQYCEALQQPDGTIIDRPCAKGERRIP